MSRRQIIKEYKNALQPIGIVQVKNIRNGRIYIAASANTQGTINSLRFQLKMGSFLPSPALSKEWNEMGEECFIIDVLDELKPFDKPKHDYKEDLKALESMWLEKLKPYGERGYH